MNPDFLAGMKVLGIILMCGGCAQLLSEETLAPWRALKHDAAAIFAAFPRTPWGVAGFAPTALVGFMLFRRGSMMRSAVVSSFAGNTGDESVLPSERRQQLQLVRAVDKLCFVIGILNVGLTCYILGAAPLSFVLWHTVKVPLLIVMRFFYLQKTKAHFFIADFCYWVNALSIVYIWLAPHSAALFQILFAAANGPLLFSILAFNNSLVLHDREKMTSVFIHTSPALLTYALRHHPSTSFALCELAAGQSSCEHVSALSMVWLCLSRFYIAWLLGYYAVVFVILGPSIEAQKGRTLYSYWTEKGVGKNLTKFHRSHWVNKAVYLLAHGVFGTVLMLVSTFVYHNKMAHMLLLIAIAVAASWNGASVYFDSFAEEYSVKLRKRLGLPSGDGSGASGASSSADASALDPKVLADVRAKIGEIKNLPPAASESLPLNVNLSSDLMFNSLDSTQLRGFLETRFNLADDVEPDEMQTVGQVVLAAMTRTAVSARVREIAPAAWTADPTQRPPISICPMAETVPAAFVYTLGRMGKCAAVADDIAGVLSYRDLRVAVILFADYILEHPDKFVGQYIGVMLPASAGFSVIAMALWFAKKVPVMINWTVGAANLRACLETAQVSTVITSEAFLGKVSVGKTADFTPLHVRSSMLVFTEQIKDGLYISDKLLALLVAPARLTARYDLNAIRARDVAVVLFTSGSESAPKGVPLSHGNIMANCRALLVSAPLFAQDVLLGILPPFHSFGFTVTSIFPLLVGGKAAFYPKPTDYSAIARQIDKWAVSIFLGTPTFLSGVLSSSTAAQTASLRFCISGAEKASDRLFQLVRERGIRDGLAEGYGITECGPCLTANVPGRPSVGVGPPMLGVRLLIVDPVHVSRVLPAGERGLILANGPGIFAGYLNLPTNNPFIEIEGVRYYNTGDLGWLDPASGALTLSGRLKRFVKVAGEMVSLPAVEDALRLVYPATEDGPQIAVEALERADAATLIALFVRAEAGLTLEQSSHTLARAGVASIAHPNVLITLPSIPLLGTGKTDYVTLKGLLKSRI